ERPAHERAAPLLGIVAEQQVRCGDEAFRCALCAEYVSATREAVQVLARLVDRAEAAERAERSERHEQFRLVVRVSVIAFPSVAWNTRGFFTRESLPRLFEIGVHLQRERRLDGKHLQ